MNSGDVILIYRATETAGTFTVSRETVSAVRNAGDTLVYDGGSVKLSELEKRGEFATFVTADKPDREAIKHGKTLAREWITGEKNRWKGVKARANSKAGAVFAADKIKRLTGLKTVCTFTA